VFEIDRYPGLEIAINAIDPPLVKFAISFYDYSVSAILVFTFHVIAFWNVYEEVVRLWFAWLICYVPAMQIYRCERSRTCIRISSSWPRATVDRGMCSEAVYGSIQF